MNYTFFISFDDFSDSISENLISLTINIGPKKLNKITYDKNSLTRSMPNNLINKTYNNLEK